MRLTESQEVTVSALIGNVYEAALDARRWPGLLKDMAGAVGAPAASLWTHDHADGSAGFDSTNGNLAAFVGYSDSAMAEYAQHYSALNVWASQTDRLPSGWVRTSDMLYPDSLFKRTEFCGGWLAPQDLFYGLGCVADRQGSRATTLGFARSERAGPFGQTELAVIERLMPHLKSAVEIHRRLHRLEAVGAGAMASLEQLPFGVILLTGAGTLLHANAAARAMAVESGALHFDPGGRLRAASTGAHHRLQALIRGAVTTGSGHATPPGGALCLPGGGGRTLQVMVAPLQASAMPFGECVAAALFCSDPGATIVGLTASLQQLYGMSPAEAALTEALVNGASLKDFAEQRATSMNTVRSQLKSASAKAGARRQADLVRVVLTGPAVWRGQR